jgi:hypothetical protein
MQGLQHIGDDIAVEVCFAARCSLMLLLTANLPLDLGQCTLAAAR